MSTHRKLMTVCCAAVLALGLAACGSSSDSDSSNTGGTDVTEPAVPELTVAQTAAATAATAAMTAAGNAGTAADDADAARANAATMQTDETSSGLAAKAREYAGAAHAAYMAAKAASEAAAAAEDITAAVRAQVDAENAQADAEAAETKAAEYGQASMEAANAELMIDGTVKSVGGTDGTSIDATAARSLVTTGEGANAQTVDTGLQAKLDQPMTMGGPTPGVAGVEGDPDASPNPYKAPVTSAAERSFPIGKLVDSADDEARLLIITKYAGLKTVPVYASINAIDVTGVVDSDGRIVISAGNIITLKPKGMYYRAGTDAAITVTAGLDTDNDNAPQGSIVGAMAEAQQVYSYVDNNNTPEVTTDDVTGNVVLTSTTVAGETTTVIYSNVALTVVLERDGDGNTTEMTEVTAKIPEAADYSHIHFGVWAGLGAAKNNGSQSIDDLGIGFVQSIGDGLSGADMPNNGMATYKGNWAATVQTEDEDGDGAISLTSGDASMTADFGKETVKADLDGLAMLSGTVSGNTFSGTKASDIGHTSLDADADFTGSFSGGFYGTKAAEAGGVFDFASDDGNNEGGAFRGAFGGKRQP